MERALSWAQQPPLGAEELCRLGSVLVLLVHADPGVWWCRHCPEPPAAPGLSGGSQVAVPRSPVQAAASAACPGPPGGWVGAGHTDVQAAPRPWAPSAGTCQRGALCLCQGHVSPAPAPGAGAGLFFGGGKSWEEPRSAPCNAVRLPQSRGLLRRSWGCAFTAPGSMRDAPASLRLQQQES